MASVIVHIYWHYKPLLDSGAMTPEDFPGGQELAEQWGISQPTASCARNLLFNPKWHARHKYARWLTEEGREKLTKEVDVPIVAEIGQEPRVGDISIVRDENLVCVSISRNYLVKVLPIVAQSDGVYWIETTDGIGNLVMRQMWENGYNNHTILVTTADAAKHMFSTPNWMPGNGGYMDPDAFYINEESDVVPYEAAARMSVPDLRDLAERTLGLGAEYLLEFKGPRGKKQLLTKLVDGGHVAPDTADTP